MCEAVARPQEPFNAVLGLSEFKETGKTAYHETEDFWLSQFLNSQKSMAFSIEKILDMWWKAGL